MNHPEFSNTDNSGFFMQKNGFYNCLRPPVEGRDKLFLATLENRAEGFFRGERVFE
jgi:hypothetical protein